MDWEVTTSRTTTILAQWQILSLPTQRCLFSTLVVFQGGIQIIKMEISDVFFAIRRRPPMVIISSYFFTPLFSCPGQLNR